MAYYIIIWRIILLYGVLYYYMAYYILIWRIILLYGVLYYFIYIKMIYPSSEPILIGFLSIFKEEKTTP